MVLMHMRIQDPWCCRRRKVLPRSVVMKIRIPHWAGKVPSYMAEVTVELFLCY